MLELLLTQFVLLWAVIDPVGSIPVFLSQTQGMSASQQRRVAIKAIVISALTLMFFLIAGQVLLEAMAVPLPAFQVAGGLVLLLFALTMIFGQSKPDSEMAMQDENLWDKAVYPLAIPSIASPGAMLAIVLLTDNDRFGLSQQAITAGIMLTVLLITLLLLLLANPIQRVIGAAGAAIISRVMGLILASVAMNELLSGLHSYFTQLHALS
ncbi:MarC family protein [Ferrimonas balearica]|uniref:MarC family protein n=1 Tax=Ferrimonas balearica TaxID=44012 RepID=UPI001C998047|nr:MarC family protein [Ferrimonas balearica]MBY5991950.1 MarC family protein [Ferrimonas balearica]